ncbi:helix-turn-helix domain-containing protein [Nitrogeniibacter aestuarii]|uniref:helix-turn-helix domain-containing protein n=1 Tax=Nitrogeniibacter aestuarii TaxID=2815343 RepID=UPI001D101103|nr:helix-turn-helix domain-containing protein [Nitrogeniibacter aestuarii]
MSIIVLHPQALVFVGPLDVVGVHRHAAPAVVVGLRQPIDFSLDGGGRVRTQVAFIRPGARHELSVGDQDALVLYLEPGSGWAQATLEACGEAAIMGGAEPLRWQALADQVRASHPADHNTLSAALDAALQPRQAQAPDARVLEALSRCRTGAAVVGAVVEVVNTQVSDSRLRHLFVANTRTTLSRYRVWCRLRSAVVAVRGGASLTDAALEAGFFDSAHFSRSFREMFGISPSAIFAREGLSIVVLEAAAPLQTGVLVS